MSDLSFLKYLAENIPASFWGVVVGSFFSMGGVYLTNKASDKRLHAQFKNERQQKIQDREMALRKEVFLSAAEAVSAGMNAIPLFSNFDLPNDQITKDYVGKAPEISKVHIIAKMETVKAMVNFTGEMGAIFLRLFARRYELMAERSQIQILNNQIAEYRQELDRTLEKTKQFNIEGNADARKWEVLQDNFTFEQQRIAEATAQANQLNMTLIPKQLEFMQECAAQTSQLGKILVPLLSAARAELELPFDEASYLLIVEGSLSRQELAIGEFVQKFMPKPNVA